MGNIEATTELMDLTKVSSTLPSEFTDELPRENLISTIRDIFSAGAEVITVEGREGIGKSTLLAQFVRSEPKSCIHLFVRASSKWAYDPVMLSNDLSQQIGWLLYGENFREPAIARDQDNLRSKILNLHQLARRTGSVFTFILDGAELIPKADISVQEEILSLLPLGLKGFRFLIAAPMECAKPFLDRCHTKSFTVPLLSLDETVKYFEKEAPDREALKTFYAVSKGFPAHLAAIKRILQSGVSADSLSANKIVDRLPDLFALEWKQVESAPQEYKLALAILTFDPRQHSLQSLSKLAGVQSEVGFDEWLRTCTFISKTENSVHFVSELFRKYAEKNLHALKQRALEASIKELMESPNSEETLRYLPDYLASAHRYEDLLTYLSAEHIRQLIQSSQSWYAVQQKALLGMRAAISLNRDADVVRFSLQNSSILTVEFAEAWRSEVEAYLALKDYAAAIEIAQRTPTREDRLHLLALIAKERKAQQLSPDPELNDQISQLYKQIPNSDWGKHGIKIAADLLHTQPDLAVEIMQGALNVDQQMEPSELAFAKLTVTAVSNSNDPAVRSASARLQAQLQDKRIHPFTSTAAVVFGEYSADRLISEVETWRNPVDRLFAIRLWCRSNSKNSDAHKVVEFGLNTIIAASEYGPSATAFRELALPVPHIREREIQRKLISRFDAQRAAIKASGPSEEYVRLELLLAEADEQAEPAAALNRLQEIYFFITENPESSTRAACLARLKNALSSLDPSGKMEGSGGIHIEVQKDLDVAVNSILEGTAFQLDALRPTIMAIATTSPTDALVIAKRLNTEPRRQEAISDIIEYLLRNVARHLDILPIAIDSFSYVNFRDNAISEMFNALAAQRKTLTGKYKDVLSLRRYLNTLSDPEMVVNAWASYYQALVMFQPEIDSADLREIEASIQGAWKKVENATERIDSGFNIATKLAEGAPEVADRFIKEAAAVRKTISFDSKEAENTYLACVRLAIRAFSGFIQRRCWSTDDLRLIECLIDRLPSQLNRAIAWSELAFRMHVFKQAAEGNKIALERVRPLLPGLPPREQWVAWLYISPVLFYSHRNKCLEDIRQLPQPYRDEALSEICSAIVAKFGPFDTADYEWSQDLELHITEVWDLLELAAEVDADYLIYFCVRAVVDASVGQPRFTREQLADIGQKIERISTSRFPAPKFIQHKGYQLLCQAQLVRFKKGNTGDWEALVNQAELIPNISDRVFVFGEIAHLMPERMREKKDALFKRARELVEMVPCTEDRLARLEALAVMTEESNPQICRDCVRSAISSPLPNTASEVDPTRRKLIDLAYRIDPKFAESLVSQSDTDEVRREQRLRLKAHFDVVKAKHEAVSADSKDNSLEKLNIQRIVETAGSLFSSLIAGRIATVRGERVREFLAQTGRMDMSQSYSVIRWAVENAVRRHGDTDEARKQITPLFTATLQASELAFNLVSRTSARFDLTSLSEAEAVVFPGVVDVGERGAAIRFIVDWVSKNAKDGILICDPYFALDEIELIFRLRSAEFRDSISVLTSRKHQKDSAVAEPFDESYPRRWRSLTDLDPGDVQITIVGERSSGGSPVHDRWILSTNAGLRIGTSINSLGLTRLSEISEMDSVAVAKVYPMVESFIQMRTREHRGERLNYASFVL